MRLHTNGSAIPFALAAVLSFPRSVSAQAASPRPTPGASAGGSCCVELSTGTSPTSRPKLFDGLGDSKLTISTVSPEAQAYFNQGLNLFHDYNSFEAKRDFAEAARLDPSCAMAYWGQAITSRVGSADEAQRTGFLARAMSLRQTATSLEQGIIEAYSRRGTAPEGSVQYAHFLNDMRALATRYPAETQVKLLLAGELWGTYDSRGIATPNQQEKEALLSDVMARFPDNVAANHYWIHAVEVSPHPERGLVSAKKLAELAPAAGHIVHMPGHIYYALGDYSKASAAFQAAHKVDAEYRQRNGVRLADNDLALHNDRYLFYSLIEQGRRREAREMALQVAGSGDTIYKELKSSGKLQQGNWPAFLYTCRMTPALAEIRLAGWDRARLRLTALAKAPADQAAPLYGLWAVYCDGMAAVSRGDTTAARKDDAEFSLLLMQVAKRKLPMSLASLAWQGGVLSVAQAELHGSVRSMSGPARDGIAMLEKAERMERYLGYSEPPQYIRPVAETIACAQFKSGRYKEAIAAYRLALKDRANDGLALFGIAQAEARIGDNAAAINAFRTFLDAWPAADADLPQVEQARAWLSGH